VCSRWLPILSRTSGWPCALAPGAAQALYSLKKVGVFDALAHGPKSADQLAKELGVPAARPRPWVQTFAKKTRWLRRPWRAPCFAFVTTPSHLDHSAVWEAL